MQSSYVCQTSDISVARDFIESESVCPMPLGFYLEIGDLQVATLVSTNLRMPWPAVSQFEGKIPLLLLNLLCLVLGL